MLVETIKHSSVPIDIKYLALHLVKDLMKQGRPAVGAVFADKYLANIMNLVMEESRKQGNGETLFLPNANPYGSSESPDKLWSVRCYKLILNCLQAWIDLYQTIDRYYTTFTLVLTSGVEFPDFSEYNISLSKSGGIPPAYPTAQASQNKGPKQVKNYPHLSGNLEQTRLLIKEMVLHNDQLEDCWLSSSSCLGYDQRVCPVACRSQI